MADLGSAFMAPLLQNQQLLSAQQQYENNKQLMPMELAQKAASTRYTASLANRMEVQDAATQRMAGLAVQQAATGGGVPLTASGQFFQLATLARKSGLLTKAEEYLKEGSQAMAHEATARNADAGEAVKRFGMVQGGIEFVTKRLDNVRNEDDWNRINQEFEGAFHQPSPFANVPYDPQVIDSLRTAAMSEYQKQIVDLREKALGATVANVDSSIRHRAAMEGIADQRLQAYKQWKQHQMKAGGDKDVGDPSKPEMEAAGRLLGDSLEGDDKDSAAFSIASNAKALRKKNPGMSADDAIRSAYGDAVKRGDIAAGEAPMKILGIPLGRQGAGKFVPAQSLPSKKADLKTGQHYTFPNGKVGEWTGKEWKQVGSGKAAAVGGGGGGGSSSSADDGEDDADE